MINTLKLSLLSPVIISVAYLPTYCPHNDLQYLRPVKPMLKFIQFNFRDFSNALTLLRHFWVSFFQMFS